LSQAWTREQEGARTPIMRNAASAMPRAMKGEEKKEGTKEEGCPGPTTSG